MKRRVSAILLASAGFAIVLLCWWLSIDKTGARSSGSDGTDPTSTVPPTLAASEQEPVRVRIRELVGDAPVSGACVTIETRTGETVERVADAAGVAMCELAVIADSVVTIRAHGYRGVRQRVPAPVAPGLEFALCSTGPIQLTVRTAAGEPVRGALLEVLRSHAPGELEDGLSALDAEAEFADRELRTDAFGRCRIEQVPQELVLDVRVAGTLKSVWVPKGLPLARLAIVLD